ncbi:putative signal peptide-containing protein [Cryptosporidium meleagridis]
MISGKLQIFIWGVFLIFLGVHSESSLLPDGTASLSKYDLSEQSRDNSPESSSSLFPEQTAVDGSLSDSLNEKVSDSLISESSKSATSRNVPSFVDSSKTVQSILEEKSGLFSESLDEKQEESASPTFPVPSEYSVSKLSDGSISPLVEKSRSSTYYDKLLEEDDEKFQSEYSPKNQEESIMLMEDPNYTVDDALALLRKQRKIHESAKGKNKKSSESFASEYESERIESPTLKYDETSRTGGKEQSISSIPEDQQYDELTFVPKELTQQRENEREGSASIPITTNFESSKRDATLEESRSSFEKSLKEPEPLTEEESEGVILDKSEEVEDSNLYKAPFSESSRSSKSVENEMSNLPESSISEKEKTATALSENTISTDNQVSQEEQSSGEELKDQIEPQIVTIPLSVSSIGNDGVKESQNSENNEASTSPKLESPIIGTESESEIENNADESHQTLSEADKSSESNDLGPEIVPVREEETSFNRSLLEEKEPSGGADEFSHEEFMERTQKSPQSDNSPLLNAETFRNEDSANQLRGILLPLVDVFQVSVGCAAPCPYQRYFIQTDRVLKRISKIEAKTIEMLNIMKKAREVTIKEVSDIFKFHNTAAKRRALLFVQKYLKSIKLLHFKVDSAKKIVLLALKVRIILQLLPSRYSREYSSEELERISSQVDLAVNEYNNLRNYLGSKTIKYGLLKYLSLNDYDPKIKSIKSILESELSGYLSKLPTFQKFVSRHRKLAFTLHEMMNKAGYPVKKRFFMIDRKGLSKEHLKLYKKKVNEDSKQAKNRLGKEYPKFKNSQENKWRAFTKKVNSS